MTRKSWLALILPWVKSSLFWTDFPFVSHKQANKLKLKTNNSVILLSMLWTFSRYCCIWQLLPDIGMYLSSTKLLGCSGMVNLYLQPILINFQLQEHSDRCSSEYQYNWMGSRTAQRNLICWRHSLTFNFSQTSPLVFKMVFSYGSSHDLHVETFSQIMNYNLPKGYYG